jgi:hypothetical protein
MATERTRTATSHTSTHATTQRNAFKAGQEVEYDGKLAKVINFGFLELPSNPGQDAAFSDKLVAHLQLPALQPGGKPEYAYFVDPSDIKDLSDDPKRQQALEVEFNALFGDKPPESGEVKYTEPKIRKAGQRSGAESVTPITDRNKRAPVDMAHAAPKGETVDTSKVEGKPAKKSQKASKKAR